MKFKHYIFSLTFVFVTVRGFSQSAVIDSLKAELFKHNSSINKPQDTLFYQLFLKLADAYRLLNPDSGIFYLGKANIIAKENADQVALAECLLSEAFYDYRQGKSYVAKQKILKAVKSLRESYETNPHNTRIINDVAKGLSNLGMFRSKEGDYDAAIRCYFISEQFSKAVANFNLTASNHLSKAIAYSLKSFNTQALTEYFESLKYYEKTQNLNMQTSVYGNIGFTYYNIKDYDKALQYYNKALTLAMNTKYKYYEAQLYGNIGSVYEDMQNIDEAGRYFQKSTKLLQQLKDSAGLASNNLNIASILVKKNELVNALNIYNTSLAYFNRTNEKRDQFMCLVELGHVYFLMNKFMESSRYFEQAERLSEEVRDMPLLVKLYNNYSELSTKTRKHDLALKQYKLHINYKDSLLNLEVQKKSLEREMQYAFNKKQTADSIKAEQERNIVFIKLEQQKHQRYLLYGGFFLVLVFSVFIYNRFKLVQKQKNKIAFQKQEVELQKKLVDEKQKEILDSIKYAERIQQALLPSKKAIKKMIG